MGKLTKAQIAALEDWAHDWVSSASPYAFGIPMRVVSNLMRPGFLEQDAEHPKIVVNKHTLFRITPAGREALSKAKEGKE